MYRSEMELNVEAMSAKMEVSDKGLRTYYDENDKLLGVSSPETLVLAVDIVEQPDRIMLLSFMKDGEIAMAEMDRNRLWVIPNDNELIQTRNIVSPNVYPRYYFPQHFLIYNFGYLEMPNFKGSKMSGTILDVYVQSCDGVCYSAAFKAAENSIAGSGKYEGTVFEGYQYSTLGFFCDGEVHLKI